MGKRKKVTTRDIAQALDISQSTVSMILSGKENVSFSENTISKVQTTAKKMGYQKPTPKTSRKENTLADTILVICPKFSGGYYSMMLHSIIERATHYHYTVLTAATLRDNESENYYLELAERNRLAGIISLYPISKVSKMNALSKQVPVISVGDKPEGCRFDSVELDSTKPGALIGSYLLSLGHTHISYISTPIRANEIGRIHRLEGLKTSFSDHGYSEEHIQVLHQSTTAFSQYPTETAEYQNAYDLTKKAIEQQTSSTAFIGNNDIAAFGILGALSDLGFKIPADYSVCGFDNIALSAMPQIALTTVEHAAVNKGTEAVDMIHRKNSQTDSKNQPGYIIRMEYEPRLIIRNTTAKARIR